MAVASFQPAAMVFREEQNFDWRAYALVLLVEVAVSLTLFWLYQRGHDPFANDGLRGVGLSLFALGGLAAPMLVTVGLLRMTTEVTPTDVRVWFGWVPTYRRFMSLGQIQKIEVVSFRPFWDYGGWGIRSRRDGERALIAKGNRGVRLELVDGTRLLIGSQRPEALAVAIERALQSGG
ncbi:MAG: hypothetical protein AB7I30_12750 [Isosphaeraceae bacterium]